MLSEALKRVQRASEFAEAVSAGDGDSSLKSQLFGSIDEPLAYQLPLEEAIRKALPEGDELDRALEELEAVHARHSAAMRADYDRLLSAIVTAAGAPGALLSEYEPEPEPEPESTGKGKRGRKKKETVEAKAAETAPTNGATNGAVSVAE